MVQAQRIYDLCIFVKMLAEIYLIQRTCFRRSKKKAKGIKKRATSSAYDMYVCISKVGISLQQCARATF